MRFALIGLAAVIAAIASGSSPAAARDYPYCLREGDEAGPGTCYYSSYQQCQAAASGRWANCYVNPRVAFGAPAYVEPGPPPVRRHHRHRRVIRHD